MLNIGGSRLLRIYDNARLLLSERLRLVGIFACSRVVWMYNREQSGRASAWVRAACSPERGSCRCIVGCVPLPE